MECPPRAPDSRRSEHAEGRDHVSTARRILRIADALRAEVHRQTPYDMRDAYQIETLARGLYPLTDSPPLAYPNAVSVAAKIPHAIVYLVSSLAVHVITTQIQHAVWIDVPL